MNSWSFDVESRHCVHESGLVAYFDENPTKSGAIRCLGPFGAPSLSEALVVNAMDQFSCWVEMRFPGCYAVWGSYEEQPKFLEHQFPILGVVCGYRPIVSLRGRINPGAWLKQWTVSSSGITHRSGLSFGGASSSFDLAVLDPATIGNEASECMRLLAKHKFTEFDPTYTDPEASWTPVLNVA